MELIKVQNLSKELNGQLILDNISFNIEQGDVFGIVGQSGSGKTTLLNTLIGFLEPDGGKVMFSLDGSKYKPLHSHLAEVKKNFGFTTQLYSFYPRLTASENFAYFSRLHDVPKKVMKSNMDNLFDFVNLSEYKNRRAEHLSVGMQRRLDIACGLANKPKVLILDEPTADLDMIMKDEIMNLIKTANQQGITVILSSHFLEGIEKICNKIAILKKGKMVQCGSMEEIKNSLGQSDAIHVESTDNSILLKEASSLNVEEAIDRGKEVVFFTKGTEEAIARLVLLSRRKGITINKFNIRKPSLREVFESAVR